MLKIDQTSQRNPRKIGGCSRAQTSPRLLRETKTSRISSEKTSSDVAREKKKGRIGVFISTWKEKEKRTKNWCIHFRVGEKRNPHTLLDFLL